MYRLGLNIWPKKAIFGRKWPCQPKITVSAENSLTAEISVTAEFWLSLSCMVQLRNFGKNPLSVTHYHNSTLFEILLHAITQITLRGSSFYFTHIIMKVCINRK